jgi:hypothetical protein
MAALVAGATDLVVAGVPAEADAERAAQAAAASCKVAAASAWLQDDRTQGVASAVMAAVFAGIHWQARSLTPHLVTLATEAATQGC